MNPIQSDVSLSKIKRIAIELKDYHFFHSPYQRAHQHKNFIGRNKKIEQFKSVLTDAISDSGNYLVTGYRGSGKTSFVNLVLSDIAWSQRLSNRGLQLLRVWFALLVLGSLFLAIFTYCSPKLAWSVLIFLLLSSICLLWLFNPLRPKLIKREKRGLPRLKQSPVGIFCKNLMGNLFYISQDEKSDYMLINLSRGIFIACLFTVLTKIFKPLQIKENFFAYMISCQILFTLVIACYSIILKIWDFSYEQNKNKNSKKINSDSSSTSVTHDNIIDKFFYWFRDRLKMMLKPRLVIRLNLNYGNLSERNILSLIANSLLEEYGKWRRSYFQMLLFFLRVFVLWLIVAIPYGYMINKPESSLTHLKAYLRVRIEKLFDTSESKLQFNLTRDVKIVSDEFDTELSRDQYNANAELLKIDSSLPALIYLNLDTFYRHIRRIVREYIVQGAMLFHVYRWQSLSTLAQSIYPPKLEPLLFLIFSIVFVVLYWVRHSRWINLSGNSRVLRLLQELDERITAAVTVQSGVEMPAPKGFAKWFRSKSLAYPLADERTIEQSIIRVLDEISCLPMIFGHPIFIFVFDELDKIALPEQMPKTQQEEMLAMSSFENMRHRQQQVEKILSNLKQLITTAHAKFIFIAGREMYDASLADFTGRSFFHSSIFNQTIYVDSFLTDHSDPEEDSFTSIVESYVCHFLLPFYEKSWCKRWPKLTDYKRYLTDRFIFSENDAMKNEQRLIQKILQFLCTNYKSQPTEIEQEQERKAIHKILQTLHGFVTYLTYRGNGSPKKIIQLFESFIQPLPESIDKKEWLVVGENHKSRYLVFSFTQQFVIGSTARLLEPLYRTIKRTAKLYNDKLTTSIFLVLDYLFKFHRSAFRRDFLEWMPEMLNIHRDPDLPAVIHEMLELIENAYLERVGNGLFDYRFTNRIKGEIDFATRIDELESATFNFTLDESLEAEQFMRRQMKDQLQLCETRSKDNKPNSTNAICHLHETVGDLHAFDGEYDQAIIEYFNALDCLRSSANKGTTDGQKSN